MSTLHSGPLRTADLASRSGYSVQQVRKLEREGVLPATPRTAAGYRQFSDIHVHALHAYRALAVALGPVEAKHFLRNVGTLPRRDTLAAMDAAHAELTAARSDLAAARAAAEYIAAEPIASVSAEDSLTVGELAIALGVRASTLRHWDAEGLVTPDRDAGGRARRYSPQQVRLARIVQQLRISGQPVKVVRELIPSLRSGLRQGDLEAAFAARDEDIERRSSALLDAASSLRVLLGPRVG
jgi:DNA-binding transcriptional MerR regulator